MTFGGGAPEGMGLGGGAMVFFGLVVFVSPLDLEVADGSFFAFKVTFLTGGVGELVTLGVGVLTDATPFGNSFPLLVADGGLVRIFGGADVCGGTGVCDG